MTVTAHHSALLERAEIEHRYNDVDPVYWETRDIRTFGFVLFLLADSVLFISFVFAYVFLRAQQPSWPPIVDGHQLPRLDVAFGALNSVILFGSGVTMQYALENWKHLKRGAFNFWMAATIVLGICFLLGQYHEYTSVQMSWAGSVFGASFFTLTGLHGFHVFCGVCYLTVLWLQARRGVYDGSRYFGLTAGTLYWHFVDVIWVFLFFLFYLW